MSFTLFPQYHNSISAVVDRGASLTLSQTLIDFRGNAVKLAKPDPSNSENILRMTLMWIFNSRQDGRSISYRNENGVGPLKVINYDKGQISLDIPEGILTDFLGYTHKLIGTWPDDTNGTVLNLSSGVINMSRTVDYVPNNPGDGSGGGGVPVPGEDGKSAYEIAVDNGFVGTEEEWLESLVGPPGAPGNDGEDGADGDDGNPGADGNDGDDGASAYEVAVLNGFVGDEVSWLASLQGEGLEDITPFGTTLVQSEDAGVARTLLELLDFAGGNDNVLVTDGSGYVTTISQSVHLANLENQYTSSGPIDTTSSFTIAYSSTTRKYFRKLVLATQELADVTGFTDNSDFRHLVLQQDATGSRAFTVNSGITVLGEDVDPNPEPNSYTSYVIFGFGTEKFIGKVG